MAHSPPPHHKPNHNIHPPGAAAALRPSKHPAPKTRSREPTWQRTVWPPLTTVTVHQGEWWLNWHQPSRGDLQVRNCKGSLNEKMPVSMKLMNQWWLSMLQDDTDKVGGSISFTRYPAILASTSPMLIMAWLNVKTIHKWIKITVHHG